MVSRAREAALVALLKVHRSGGYSNIVLDQLLEGTDMAAADRALASRLLYGVIERRLTLDYLLGECASMPLKRMHPDVLEILRMGAYQLLFLDKVPPAAAIHEAVELTRVRGQAGASGFVNGVLRGVQRRGRALLDALPDTPEGLERRTSCPRALTTLWQAAYGPDMALQLTEHSNDIPPICLRVNTLKTTPDAFAAYLREAGIPFTWEPDLPACLRLKEGSFVKRLALEGENWYYHQDTASQFCCAALSPRPGDRVADVCAAPGGKSFTLAQWMENRGAILAGDLYPAKCEQMDRRAEALGITILRTAARDAAAPCPEPLCGAFDRVLADVPCSGLGVIRRKPEIRYKDPASFAQLPELQYAILAQAARMVRPGGVLQYSTCTLNPAENEAVAARFLREHADFTPRVLPLPPHLWERGETSHQLTLFPPVHGTDGFYMAGFQKLG